MRASASRRYPFALPLFGAPDMPVVFAVVGEQRDDPDRLLMLGEDGRHYDYRLDSGQTAPVEPDEEEWRVDAGSAPGEETLGI